MVYPCNRTSRRGSSKVKSQNEKTELRGVFFDLFRFEPLGWCVLFIQAMQAEKKNANPLSWFIRGDSDSNDKNTSSMMSAQISNGGSAIWISICHLRRPMK
jgi:hypothetical protein